MATSSSIAATVPAVYLEISNRDPADAVVYPDVDLLWNPPGPAAQVHAAGRDALLSVQSRQWSVTETLRPGRV